MISFEKKTITSQTTFIYMLYTYIKIRYFYNNNRGLTNIINELVLSYRELLYISD